MSEQVRIFLELYNQLEAKLRKKGTTAREFSATLPRREGFMLQKLRVYRNYLAHSMGEDNYPGEVNLVAWNAFLQDLIQRI